MIKQAHTATTWATARRWGSRILLGINLLVAVIVFFAFADHPVKFTGDWNGSNVATMAMTAATIAMAAVTLMVGIIALWGYGTLRDHSEKIAKETALDAAQKAVQDALGAYIEILARISHRGL